MPEGIHTLIGDRGIKLSGGQRIRVSLARALYSDSDIFLLDDPFSALDYELANKIFAECILGYLKNKIRVVVTHKLLFLKHSKKILYL